MPQIEYTVIPNGTPPAKLESGEDADILKWCHSCQAARPKERLSTEAFKYWIRYFHNVWTPEHNRICSRIDELMPGSALSKSSAYLGQEEELTTSEGSVLDDDSTEA